ncbi:MAG: hypothetical protein M1814_003014 [Vezdaea aestivalis]|nr:MAG: hypothetical protein M1814_003014 [Vezdaea aestivalis]
MAAIPSDLSSKLLTTPISASATLSEADSDSDLNPPSVVSSDANGLRFEASASLQLRHLNPSLSPPPSSSNLLVISPYTSHEHLLDLRSVSLPNQLLAKAMTLFRPTRPDYATAPYPDSFNWADVISEYTHLSNHQSDPQLLSQQTFHLISFHSRLPPSTSRAHLSALDAASHLEAVRSGGLLKYWFGEPDSEGRNLATCVWREKKDASMGSRGRGHSRAAGETRGLYTDWRVGRWALRVGGDLGVGKWLLEKIE